MSKIEANGVIIKLPDNIKVADGKVTRADEATQQRTLDEAEVQQLIEIKRIDAIPNPLDPASLPIAEVGLLERAAKSDKKWPRIFFYSVFVLAPTSCMEVPLVSAARADNITWLYPCLLGLAVLMAALQIILIATEKKSA